MQRTVIFDLDGTLADTSGDLLAAADAAFAALGHGARLDRDAEEDRATAVRGARAMLRLGLARQGLSGEALEREVDRGVPHLREAGHRVGICTNKPQALAEKLMRALGTRDLFHSLVGADTLPVRKPDPRPLREAVARAGGAMGGAVLVGDTRTDRDTARAAGVPCVLVTFPPADGAVAGLMPDALLHGFGDLVGVLETL